MTHAAILISCLLFEPPKLTFLFEEYDLYYLQVLHFYRFFYQ